MDTLLIPCWPAIASQSASHVAHDKSPCVSRRITICFHTGPRLVLDCLPEDDDDCVDAHSGYEDRKVRRKGTTSADMCADGDGSHADDDKVSPQFYNDADDG